VVFGAHLQCSGCGGGIPRAARTSPWAVTNSHLWCSKKRLIGWRKLKADEKFGVVGLALFVDMALAEVRWATFVSRSGFKGAIRANQPDSVLGFSWMREADADSRLITFWALVCIENASFRGVENGYRLLKLRVWRWILLHVLPTLLGRRP